MIIAIVIDTLGLVPKSLKKGLEELKIRIQIETIQTYSIVEIGQNTKKRPKDLRKLSATHTSDKLS